MIREVTIEDATEICDIYNYYIENTIITFEEKLITVEEMQSRIREVTQFLPWFVFEKDNKILGYCYTAKWKTRSAYRFAVEITVYLKSGQQGHGLGSFLFERILDKLKTKNVHSVIGGIALPNEGSQKLHEKFGFKKVAHFNEAGYKFNQWIDVGYWELILSHQPRERPLHFGQS